MKIFIHSLVIFFLLSACTPIKETEQIENWRTIEEKKQVVWADDNFEVATVILKYEQRKATSGKIVKRNFKHRIFSQQLDDQNPKPLTDWRDHQNGNIYYMRRNKYLLVESILDNGARRFDKIILDNSNKEIPIFESKSVEQYLPCGSVDLENVKPLAQVHHIVLPSPDGQQLAQVFSLECGKVTVQFEHAKTLQYIDSATLNIDQPFSPTWHLEGYLILAGYDGKTAWKVTTQSPPTRVDYPKCLFPPTTSSPVSLEGKLVYFDEEKTHLLTRKMDKDQVFGCQ